MKLDLDIEILRTNLLALADKEFVSYLEDAFAFGAKIENFPPHYMLLKTDRIDETKYAFYTEPVQVLRFEAFENPSMFDVGLKLKPKLEESNALGMFFFVYGETSEKDLNERMVFVFLIADGAIAGVAGYPINGEQVGEQIELPLKFVPNQIEDLLFGLTAEAH
jgi:hypothetical protein